MTFLLAFLASALYIALKSTQQLNVVHGQYRRIMPVSMSMAACEVFIMVNVVRTSDSGVGLALLAVCIGVGGGLGCMAGMRMHKKQYRAPVLFGKN